MFCISHEVSNNLFFGGFGFTAALAIGRTFAAMDANARLTRAFRLAIQRHPALALFFVGHGFEIKSYDGKNGSV